MSSDLRPLSDTALSALVEVARLQDMNAELLRFIKVVADCSNDGRLSWQAEELVMLYGNPDAKKPRGVIGV